MRCPVARQRPETQKETDVDGKLKALDWILSVGLAVLYAAGLGLIIAYGKGDDLLAAAVMVAMGILGFVFVVVEAVRFAKPPFALFQAGVLSALSFLCPLILLDGLKPLLLLVGLAAVVAPACAFAAVLAWAERGGHQPARRIMRVSAGVILAAGLVVGIAQLAPGLCARWNLTSTAVRHPKGLEFRVVAEIGEDGLTYERVQSLLQTDVAPPSWIWMPLADHVEDSALPRDVVRRVDGGARYVLLADEAPYTMTPDSDPGWGIRSAKVTEEKQEDGRQVWVFLDITFDEAGGTRLHDLSSACLGRGLAIVVGGTVRSVPMVQTPLGRSVRIHVGVARGEGDSLVAALSELRSKAEALRALF